MATKNNPKNKGLSGGKKFLNGKELEPIEYVGNSIGSGRYMSAKYTKTNEIIIASNGKPVVWDDIPVSKE